MDKIDIENKLEELTGFCGCGNPDEAYKLLYDVLLILDKRSDYSEKRNEYWEKSYKDIKNLLPWKDEGDNGLYWTYFYYLDNKGFVEHGSSVDGCWITKEGYELLGLLKEYFSINDAGNKE